MKLGQAASRTMTVKMALYHADESGTKYRSGLSHKTYSLAPVEDEGMTSREQKYGRMEGDFHAQWSPDTSSPWLWKALEVSC